MTRLEQSFQKEFERTKDNSPEFWKEKRLSALDTFQKQGIPTNKDEEWKYTLLRGISDKDYSYAPTLDLAKARNKRLSGLEGIELFFVNGKLVNEVDGLSVSPLSSCLLYTSDAADD